MLCGFLWGAMRHQYIVVTHLHGHYMKCKHKKSRGWTRNRQKSNKLWSVELILLHHPVVLAQGGGKVVRSVIL